MTLVGMAVSILWRYSAILAQFGIVTIIAHKAPVADAGRYFAEFGFVAVAFTVVGLGASDGLVRRLPVMVRDGDSTHTRRVLVHTVVGSAASTIGMGGIAVVASALLRPGSTGTVSALVAWWLGYCFVFLFSQITTGLGFSARGAFVAYSLINIAYLAIQIPYLLVARNVTLHGVLTAAISSTYVAVFVALLVARKSWRDTGLSPCATSTPEPGFSSTYRELVRDGFPMMTSRLLQASLPWIPVWVLTLAGTPVLSAEYGAASRLVVAANSVIAALRFAVRPRIVLLYADRDWTGLIRLARRCSTIASLPPILACCLLPFAGSWTIGHLLGGRYAEALPVLEILVLGVVAEAVGGVSDEILKMTGNTRVVLATLVAAALFQAVGSPLAAPLGMVAMAGVTAAAFALQYGAQLAWLSRYTPLRIWGRGNSQSIGELA